MWFSRLFTAHGHYEKGFLPDEGPVSAQGFKMMRLLGMLEGMIEECREEKNKKDKRRSNRPAPRGVGAPRAG